MKATPLFCAIGYAILLSNTRLACGQLVWQPTAGGLFNTPTNWSPPGPPVAGSVTLFNSAATQTVTMETNSALGTNRVENGNVTFQLNQTIQTMSGGAGLIVGNVAGTTARFTILNGRLIGDMTLGNIDSSTGFFTIGTAAAFDAGSNSTVVGNSGVGTLTLTNGGGYTGTANLILGNLTASNGAVIVSGFGSSLTTNAGNIVVGANSIGSFTVSGGGTASGALVNIGDAAIGVGSLAVSDAGSAFTNTGLFNVGNSGIGQAFVTGGGNLTTQASRIAAATGSFGSAVVTGDGSMWNAASLAVGGVLGTGGGAGTLQITADGTVKVTGNMEIRNTSNTAVTINGGTLAVNGSLTRLGTLNFFDGTLHLSGLFDNGTTATPIVIDGSTATALPTLQLSNSSGSLAHVSSITVGAVNHGALVVDTGRMVTLGANSLLIGTTATGNGDVTVTGANSALSTTQTISIGGNAAAAQGIGSLTIQNNGSVSTSVLNVFPQGTLTIDNGTLSAATYSISSGANVNFDRGRINLTATNTTLTTPFLDVLLGTTHELGPNRTIGGGASTIAIQSPITINGGTVTSGAGGPLENSSSVNLTAGTLSADAALTNDAGRTITISGTGLLTAGSIVNNGTLALNNSLVPVGGGSFTNGGVIRGTGAIGNTLTNSASGQIQVTAGNRLELTSGAIINNGLVSVDGGELVISVGMTNNGGSLISGRDGVIRGGTTGILNSGAMAFSGGTMDVYGDVTQQTSGKITITGGGSTTFYDDVTVNAGANNVQVSAAGGVVSSVVFLGSYNGGTTGGGAAFIEGDHRPGNSPALVSFGGALFYGSGSELDIELGGLNRGTQYDAVDGTSAVSLSGKLDVTTISGFTPTIGNSFTLLTAVGGITGQFTSTALPVLGSGQWQVTYNPTSVVLAVVGALLGDYNHNGVVDAADYVVWRSTLGQTGTGLAADGNNNSVIDAGDLTVWRSHFGATAGSGAGAGIGTSTQVPEPSAFVLLIAAVSTLVACRRAR
ncbi:MAG TPA: hypothetical protein VHU84_10225 [Lacipirellulaceae bacterium]|nr:hypothetical protein [Lacipirellulaceae bacterium]